MPEPFACPVALDTLDVRLVVRAVGVELRLWVMRSDVALRTQLVGFLVSELVVILDGVGVVARRTGQRNEPLGLHGHLLTDEALGGHAVETRVPGIWEF